MQLDPRLLTLARQKRSAFLLTLGLGFLAGVLAIAQAGTLAKIVSQVFLEGIVLGEVAQPVIALLAILLLRPVLGLFSDISAQNAARKIKSELRKRLLKQVDLLGPAYTQSEQSGSLTNTIIDGVEAIDAYCKKYKVEGRAALIREMALRSVMGRFLDDYPTLFEKQDLDRLVVS